MNSKKILVICDEFYPKMSAISSVILTTCKSLITCYKDLSIDVLCCKYGGTPTRPYHIQGVDKRLRVISHEASWQKNQRLTERLQNSKAILGKIYSRVSLHFLNKNEGNEGKRYKPAVKKILRLYRRNKYDFLLAVQYPYYNIALALETKKVLKDKLKYVTLLTDPHADHINNINQPEEIAKKVLEENNIYTNFDKILTTPELYYNITNSPIQNYKEKITILPSLPNLINNTISTLNQDDKLTGGGMILFLPALLGI